MSQQIVLNNNSELEIMNLVLCGIFSCGLNFGPFYLTGFFTIILSCFFLICNIELVGFASIILFFTCVFFDIFTIARITPYTMGKDIEREHFKIFRSVFMIKVAICIFLTDFPTLWNPRLNKTISYGISLMDAGLFGFLFNAGFTKKRTVNSLVGRRNLFLIAAGFIRLFIVNKLNYEVSPTEYGIHLNFYFILAIINILYNIYKSICNLPYLFDTTIGFSLLFAHKQLLDPEIILNNDRSTFFMQNKEGINSIVGYFAFILIVADFGNAYRKTNKKFLLVFIYFILSLINYKFFLLRDILSDPNSVHKEMSRAFFYGSFLDKNSFYVSRRLCNLNFINWGLFIDFFSFLSTYVFSHMFPIMLEKNVIIEFVSKNMMLIFIITNLCIIPTKMYLTDTHNPLLVNICYLFINFVIVPKGIEMFQLRPWSKVIEKNK
ncbi:pigw [Nucleospora cyclopteri]